MRASLIPCCLILGLGACATGPGPGATLDPELVELARTSGEVGGIKIRTDKNGAVVKMAVYHAEESAVPAWARGMASEKWPDSTLRSYETEWYADAGRVYEIEVTTKEGTKCEISVSASGAERYTECEIDPDALPEPIAATLAKALPNGKVKEAETHEGPDIDEVSMEVEAGGQEHYIRIRSDGKLLEHLLRLPTILEVPAP
jgi:hypothetical protein